jgi:hypothetical protein
MLQVAFELNGNAKAALQRKLDPLGSRQAA